MNVPSIMKGFGTSFAAIQAAFQAFAINLKKEAGKKGFIPSRLMDDLQASDSKVLNDLVEGLFMKKLSLPAHRRLVMWPAIPDALTMPAFKAVAAPILFGNVGAFDVTMHEKKFMGSVRLSFTWKANHVCCSVVRGAQGLQGYAPPAGGPRRRSSCSSPATNFKDGAGLVPQFDGGLVL